MKHLQGCPKDCSVGRANVDAYWKRRRDVAEDQRVGVQFTPADLDQTAKYLGKPKIAKVGLRPGRSAFARTLLESDECVDLNK